MPRAKRRALGRHTPQRARARQRQQVQENDGPDDHVNVDLEIQVNQFENLPTALRYDPATFTYKCTIGGLTVQCTQCNASKFPDESVGMCCSNGKVDLPSLPDLPAELATLFKGESEESIHFLSNLRQYNCAFQMTSFGCKEVTLTGWNPNFRIQGQVCHLIGALEPATQQEASYLQIYFMDGEMEQAHRRISLFDGLRPELIFLLQDLLHIHNKYVKQLKSAYEFARNRNFPTYRIVICENVRPPGEHERRYNLPEANEVAILMPNDPIGHRDIVLHARTNELRRISELHKSYDALQYPLLFPFGTDGWSLQLKLGSRHKITQLQYYCFNIFTRHSNYLLLGRRLFQQYLVDSYAKIESERLQFLRREQGRLRAENYNDLRDSILHNDGNPHNVGQRVILPATYCGGPRYMFERQQDAMSYVRKFGRPDLFITATTNPGWTEIKENLSVGQQPHDRPDLIVRVFRQKLKKLMDFLKEGAFGPLQAWLYSIEFQKRGLPHAHILLWLQKENKIHPEMIDRVICAELPDKTVDPHLFNIVEKNMIHGPCGPGQMSPCMKDGKCTKSFPRPFLQNTELGTDSYPKYRRRQPCDGGGTAVVKRGREEINVDNRWVVPYNPWLLRQMDCHVNVELCMSVKSIKYVLKYVHKGADQATFQLQSDNNKDEISNFVNSRYIGSTEAAWRIFEMPLHERYPPVVQLSVHLENGQRVYFNEDTAVDTANAEPRPTTLTAFFELCGSDPFAATITYQDVPKYYTWNTTQKKWNRRKRGTPTVFPDVFETPTLGRIYTISPKQAECFYLRLLLLTVEGPISFDSLKSYDGHVYPTYRDCCIARGLLEDDNMHRQTIEEAAVSSLPKALRNLFAVLLTQACPSDPKALWEEFQQQLSEDFFSNLETTEASRNSALIDIEDTVLAMGGTTLGNLGLPQPIRGAAERIGQDYQREISYNIEEQRQKADLNLNNLTEDQSRIFYDFIGHLQAGHYGLFFLDAPGGCGKTYLLETILATVRGHNQICIATASSGLAATLLPGGRTVHSTFKVPLSVANMDLPTCNIKKGTSLSRLLQEAAVLIIDEAPMLHRKVLEALDRTLRDIRSSENTMGGLLTLMCGDFRQILPVVPHGTRANIIERMHKGISTVAEHPHILTDHQHASRIDKA